MLVTGRVQGVWFRASTETMAHERGLAGSVANGSDGRVEAVFEGRDADVEHAIAWCREGPRLARVDSVEVADEPLTGAIEFIIR